MKYKNYILILVFLLASWAIHGQQATDTIIDLTSDDAMNKTFQLSDSVIESLIVTGAENFGDSQINILNDSIEDFNDLITLLEDSLHTFKFLKQIDQKRAVLLDTLSSLQLPPELSNTIDSLRSLPTMIISFRSKIDLLKYQSADTLITRYIDKAREFIAEQQTNLEQKASSLLPEQFYSKLDKLKSKAGAGKELDALSRVDELTSNYELDYKKYLSMDQVQVLLNTDLQFLDNLKEYTDKLDLYTGQFDQYMGQLNQYLGKADLSGITDLNVGSIEELAGNIELPDNLSTDALKDKISLDGISGLEGMNPEEVQKLISEYSQLDAEQLDKRIDQLAGKYEGFQELSKQTSAFESMKSENFGQLDQFKSLTAEKFDRQTALKKGRVLANDVIKSNPEIIQTAMKEVEAFKKKYAIVTNSNFKEEDVEKPTKHVETQKRFFFGGDFQLLPGDPFGIDVAGLAGYRVANRISAGLAASIRYEFEESENFMPDFTKEPVYGGRAYVQYKAIKSFFIQGETEAANVYNESAQKIWEFNYLAGIGRTMSIKDKLNLNVTFLYHINNKGSYAHDRPFVIRIGFSSK